MLDDKYESHSKLTEFAGYYWAKNCSFIPGNDKN